MPSVGRSYKPTLVATDEQIRSSYAKLRTRMDVADLLEVPDGFLRWILYVKRERGLYREGVIPKKTGGERRICTPPQNLRILQDKLLRVLSLVYDARPCVTGFVRGRSILSNAEPHTAPRYLFNFDIADFFPSLHFGRVRAMFESFPQPIGANAAITLAQIVTHQDGHLPQGAPTSPIVANMICGPFDSDMIALAKRHRCHYTRYADDISISTTRRSMPAEIVLCNGDECHLGPELLKLVCTTHKFNVRPEKTRLRPYDRRQRATGLVVNEFPNLSRVFIRSLRALIHDALVNGLAAAAARHAIARRRKPGAASEAWLRRVIEGKLSFTMMIRGEHDFLYRKLRLSAMPLDLRLPPALPANQIKSQALTGRTRPECDWRTWARRYATAVHFLECVNPKTTDKHAATAFGCGAHLITAVHNTRSVDDSGAEAIHELTLLFDSGSVRVEELAVGDVGRGFDIAMRRLPDDMPESTESIPTQERTPEVGEEVAALGYPRIPRRGTPLVLHVGRVEAISLADERAAYISVSFPSGPGLSGGPLLDVNGYCVGVMSENTFMKPEEPVGGGKGVAGPGKPYGQALLLRHWRDVPGAPRRL